MKVCWHDLYQGPIINDICSLSIVVLNDLLPRLYWSTILEEPPKGIILGY